MKNYLFFDIEATSNEVSIKVDTIFGAEDNNESSFTISDDEYVPTKGDKLYFLPGVNIPRVKLKDLTMEHGIKSVRDINDATHIFASKGTVHKISDHRWFYRMKTDHFKEMYETVKQFMDDYYIENIDTALEFYQEQYVYMDYGSSSEIRNETPFLEARTNIPGLVASISSSRCFYAVNDSYKDYFPAVTNLTIYNEAKLLKYINGADAVIIDSVMFDQLSDMFKSSDNDNHILAMEIMANSNYIDSLLYLELLFKEYHNQMFNCHTKKHVNFKSLLGYLGKDSYMNTDIDDIMKSLIDKGVLDTDKINVIMNKYAHEIESRGGTDYFKVKTVTVNPETLALLNKNYVYKSLEDFVPEGQEEDFPELHANLEDLNSIPGVAGVAPGVEGVESDLEISDDDIETALLRIERNELKSELIDLEQSENVSEFELNEISGTPAEELNTNQTEEKDDNDFEWF
jgi:hypothetical protein